MKWNVSIKCIHIDSVARWIGPKIVAHDDDGKQSVEIEVAAIEWEKKNQSNRFRVEIWKSEAKIRHSQEITTKMSIKCVFYCVNTICSGNSIFETHDMFSSWSIAISHISTSTSSSFFFTRAVSLNIPYYSHWISVLKSFKHIEQYLWCM